MKWLLTIFIFSPVFSFAQQHTASYPSIDWKVSRIEAPTLDSLAKELTSNCSTELEKTRAIFSWIAQHIAYNTGIFTAGRGFRQARYVEDPYDTVSLKSPTEQTAEKVLKRRVAVCDGYARLFKTLCDYAGLQSEVIVGYGKGYLERAERFRTNHTWNAVRIDSTWHLLDVTWASGYVNFSNEFVPHIDESYFLTPPAQFIQDHYPEDLQWTLMEHPSTMREFHFSPFHYKSFVKYGIISASPANGTIEAKVGDTVRIELKLRDARADSSVAPDAFFDSTVIVNSPASVFLKPVIRGHSAVYTYVVESDAVDWLHLLYNEDPVLRYKLSVKIQRSTN